eukprot:31510-Pelagococcus_subviridis.AAC.26
MISSVGGRRRTPFVLYHSSAELALVPSALSSVRSRSRVIYVAQPLPRPFVPVSPRSKIYIRPLRPRPPSRPTDRRQKPITRC